MRGPALASSGPNAPRHSGSRRVGGTAQIWTSTPTQISFYSQTNWTSSRGLDRNIPGSVVDETIDHGQVVENLGDRTVYYDPRNDVTVVQSDTTGKIMSVRRGAP
jgi:hypothetical protein